MNENNPWQRPKKPQNIDEWVDQALAKIKGRLWGSPPGNGTPTKHQPSFWQFGLVGGLVLAAVVAYILFNTFFQIQPGEVGVVLRFGKFDHNAQPGLNLLIPFAETLQKVNIEAVRSLEFGVQGSQDENSVDSENAMITGDRNVIRINWAVQYRIKNPENYLFKIQNVTGTLRDFSEYVVRRLVGNRDFDYVFNTREELAFEAKQELQKMLDDYNSGVELVALQLLDVTPPEAVRAAFNDVNVADQDRTRLVNEAQKEVNEKVPRAKGQALQLVSEAEGYAIRRTNNAEGDTGRFIKIYEQYARYRAITRTQLYIDAMKEVLPKITNIYILDKNKNLLPLLNLSAAAIVNNVGGQKDAT